MKINCLTSDVYNRIAAGEVIDRPYSVVKELVENAIDAGATEITVETTEGGKKLVRVTDNGSGIGKDDLFNAFMPHATSKLKVAEDLERIATLGFRGEAIASVASVSKMTILSATEEGEAYSLTSNGGVMGEVLRDAGSKGTVVSVEDLFFNTPARLKFLKSDSQEESDIANMVSRFILSRPEISFTYYANGKLKYRSYGDGLSSAVAAVYGVETLSKCYRINADKHGICVSGYIGNQNFSKANRSYQSLFVNGRYVVNQTVSSAITNAYASYLMKRQYPFYVLFLDVPTEIVDVNVHPNKADVRFADNRIIYGSVYHVLSSVLDGNSRALEYLVDEKTGKGTSVQMDLGEVAIPKSEIVTPQKVEKSTAPILDKKAEFTGFTVKNDPVKSTMTDINEKKPQNPVDFVIPESMKKTEMTYEEAKKELQMEVPVYANSSYKNVFEVNSPRKEEVKKEEIDFFEENKRFLAEQEKKKQEKIDPQTLVFKGELFRTYLIYEVGDTAYLIDQHAAHERILYDNLRKKLDERKVVAQPMLIPYVLNVNPAESNFLSDNLSVLQEIGFEIEEFGLNAFKISAVPIDLQFIDLKSFFDEVLYEMDTLRAIKLPDLLKDKLASSACKAAVKGGEYLTEEEAKGLLERMQGDMGLRCPHGRPVAVKLTKTEIEKMFKRIV